MEENRSNRGAGFGECVCDEKIRPAQEKKLKIGIVGLGMIGNSFSALTTMHGYPTVCYARSREKIPGYRKSYDALFQEMENQGILTSVQSGICRSYLSYVSSYEELSDCDVVFEAITEDLEQKKRCYAELERCCGKLLFIGSCSSSIVPERLASAASVYKDRVIVTHPFYPVHMVPYFELCGCAETKDGVLDCARDLLIALDRKPVILKKPNPGFIGNYLQFALWAAALKLYEDGVCEPEDIDTCLRYSFCPRYTGIGIFEHFDNGGYRLNRATCDAVFPALPRYEEAPAVIREKAEDPLAWGARAPEKRGFYDWSNVDMEAYQKRVNAPYWHFIDWELPEKPMDKRKDDE